jgi:hypothetical protein
MVYVWLTYWNENLSLLREGDLKIFRKRGFLGCMKHFQVQVLEQSVTLIKI